MHHIVFYGTSPFAVPSLQALAKDERFSILAVVTQPDRPAGRKGTLKKSAVKLTAEELGLRVLQPENVKTEEAFQELKSIGGDAAVVASYGQIVPQRLLDLYPHGMVNVHGSLLPEYRGASPIQAAIRDGKNETGVSIMIMDAELDHGPVLAMEKEPIREDDTFASIFPRLAGLGANLLVDTLEGYLKGNIKPQEQDHARATIVKTLSREDGRLNPTRSAQELERLVRAMNPWPGTYLEEDGKRLKVLQARVGTSDTYPTLTCADGSVLSLVMVQPEGKKPMDGAAYLRGKR